jgi:hypothetical protein
MRRPSDAIDYLSWFLRIFVVFVRTDRWSTWASVLSGVVSKLASVLAFFLPLKVVLLVGSPGVPRYFEWLVSPEHKNVWVVIIAAFAVLCYVVSVAAETISHRSASKVGRQVMSNANALMLFGNQFISGEGIFEGISGAIASGLFAILMLVVGLALYPLVFSSIVVVIFVQALVAVNLATGRFGHRGSQSYVVSNTNDYLSAMSSIGFLVSFGVILGDLLVTGGPNLLLVILAVLVSRQVFSNASGSMGQFVRLARDRSRVDALVFRSRHMPQRLREEQSALTREFEANVRVRRTAELVGHQGVLFSLWRDVSDNNLMAFDVVLGADGCAGGSRFVEMVYPKRMKNLLVNESVLGRHIEQSHVGFPEILGDYETESFCGRLYAADFDLRPSREEWAELRYRMLVDLWFCGASDDLVRIYSLSHPLPQNRVTKEFFDQFHVAVRTREEERLCVKFAEQVDVILSRLESAPLALFNPDLSFDTVTRDEAGRPLAVCWGRWSLQPPGWGLHPEEIGNSALCRFLSDPGGRVPGTRVVRDDILFHCLVGRLELAADRRKYGMGLRVMRNLLTLVNSTR